MIVKTIENCLAGKVSDTKEQTINTKVFVDDEHTDICKLRGHFRWLVMLDGQVRCTQRKCDLNLFYSRDAD